MTGERDERADVGRYIVERMGNVELVLELYGRRDVHEQGTNDNRVR